MSENELDLKQIKKLLIAYRGDYISVHFVLREFLSWHKSERKKWALNLLIKTYKSWLNSEKSGTFEMAIRKKIEEG